MKFRNFCRTTLGKIILYLTFILSGLALAFSGAMIILANGFKLYFDDYNKASYNYVYSRHFYDEISMYVDEYGQNYLRGIPGGESIDVPLVISDEDGNTLAIYNEDRLDRASQQVICKQYFMLNGSDKNNSIEVYDDYQAAVSNRLNNPSYQTIISVEAYYDEGMIGNSSIQGILIVLSMADMFKYASYPIAFVALILMICSFVFLMSAAGHKVGTDEVTLGVIARIPADILFVIVSLLIIGAFCLVISVLDMQDAIAYLWGILALIVVCGALCLLVFAAFCSCIAARLKLRNLIKGTFIYMILAFCSRKAISILKALQYLLLSLPVTWKALAILIGISFFEFFGILVLHHDIDMLLALWFLEKVALCVITMFLAIGLNKLKIGGEKIAEGQTFTIDRKYLWGDMNKHADNLSNISEGMSKAVEEKLKSERMKTELITNVSHDIKTPLTSIINYAGLVAAEDTDNTKIKEYSGVLVKQSEKLKKLIEDLVEASKAGSGNLEVDLVLCDAGTFISQASGEYEEKMSKVNLTLICNQPETETMIMADPRRMWRVFDNLMNNICKYSLENSRVYLTLRKVDNTAIIEFKNTSRDELNISPDELMERFTRGDKSRNTEGNGLGLSIASSLTKLQGGELDISIDGDLFKATLKFPVAK